jgi:hypothetical protein
MNRLLTAPLLLTMFFGPMVYGSQTQVNWVTPEKYRDVRPNDNLGKEKFRQQVLTKLERHFAKEANKLASDKTLVFTVTDLDLAGEVKPIFGGTWVRVIESLYSPMISFSFRLESANGEVVREGEYVLRDLGFDIRKSKTTSARDLYFEKNMISQWFRKTFKDT